MTLPRPEEFTHHHKWVLRAFSRQPDDIGAASLQLWENLARELISIIGEAGFESLYSRCVFLMQDEFSWLQLSRSSTQIGTRFSELKHQLNQQELALAERASRRLLDTFMRLLSGLIGDGLTRNILQVAWDKVLPDDDIIQDKSKNEAASSDP
jgi:hypothetical protein